MILGNWVSGSGLGGMLVDREVFMLLQIAPTLCAPDTDAAWAQDSLSLSPTLSYFFRHLLSRVSNVSRHGGLVMGQVNGSCARVSDSVCLGEEGWKRPFQQVSREH